MVTGVICCIARLLRIFREIADTAIFPGYSGPGTAVGAASFGGWDESRTIR
jgi:hypothetical protein